MPNIDPQAFRILLETAPDGFFLHDAAGRFLDGNAQFCGDLGYSRDELLGLSVGDVFPGSVLDASAGPWSGALRVRQRDVAICKGEASVTMELSLTRETIEGQLLFLGITRRLGDFVSERDPLTGLANRRALDEELAKACLHATRTGEPLTLAMIDFDHFKLFNDEQGHVRGDEALKAVADILQSAARRPYDLAARYGGDEFLLLLPGVEEPEALIERILGQVAGLDITHPGSPDAPRLAVSCGCVIASELADVSPRDLLIQCDRALCEAKEAGRNRVHISRL